VAKKINTIIGIIIMVCLIPFSGRIKSAAADNTVAVVIETDSLTYASDSQVDMCVNLTQYGENFDGNITTMIIEVTYDSSKLVLDKSSVKKIADDNGGMGFSHVSIADGVITYQYLNVEEPLKKGDNALFSCVFRSTEEISIDNVLTISRAIVQDGQHAESVRFPVSTSFKADKEAEQIVSDKNTGSYLYNEQGDYIYEEQQTEASKENQNEKTSENTNNGNSGESSKEENTGDNNTEEKNTAQAGVEEESRTGDRGDVKQGESQQLSDVTEADTTDGGRNTWMIFLVALAVIAEIAVVLFLRKKHL
jgi:hypothetical protein